MNCEKSTKAIFLDRDGIINIDTGYIHKPDEIIFTEGIFKFCRKAIDKGYILVVITNQAGVAKRYYSEDDVNILHAWMNERFNDEGINIAGFYYCPFHKDAKIKKYKRKLNMRKPEPGMVLKAAEEHNIDINNSIMVGDKQTDRIKLKGLKSIIVKSRYTANNFDVESLDEVIDLI